MSFNEASSESTPRILVVEDDDDARQVIREVLENAGFAVSEASNGERALDSMRARPEPAFVVLDLEMPVMSGGELLERMREDERLSSVPVLILSGTEKWRAPQGKSVVGFVSKPCNMKGLVEAVSEYVPASPSR